MKCHNHHRDKGMFKETQIDIPKIIDVGLYDPLTKKSVKFEKNNSGDYNWCCDCTIVSGDSEETPDKQLPKK